MMNKLSISFDIKGSCSVKDLEDHERRESQRRSPKQTHALIKAMLSERQHENTFASRSLSNWSK